MLALNNYCHLLFSRFKFNLRLYPGADPGGLRGLKTPPKLRRGGLRPVLPRGIIIVLFISETFDSVNVREKRHLESQSRPILFESHTNMIAQVTDRLNLALVKTMYVPHAHNMMDNGHKLMIKVSGSNTHYHPTYN